MAVGHGPPLVQFPGLGPGGATPTGLQRRFTVQSLKPLARQLTVYSVHRRPGLKKGSTIRDLAEQYAEAIDAEFSEPVRVQGISTGGSIAQQFAIDHPRLVRRLVLVASACRLSPHGREMQRRLAVLAAAGSQRRAWATLGPGMAASAAGGRLMAALLWLLGGAPMAAQDCADLIATIVAEDAFDAAEDLHRIPVPTLVIGGARDRFYSPELFRETAARIPDARLCLYPRKGHAGTVSSASTFREVLGFLT